MDTHRRTFVKAVLWALIGLVSMALVGRVFTGSFVMGGAMAVVNTLIGLASYVVYERVWARIGWGRVTAR